MSQFYPATCLSFTPPCTVEVAGLRNKTKIMTGGGQIDDIIRRNTKSDAYGKDAMAAVSMAKEWIGVK